MHLLRMNWHAYQQRVNAAKQATQMEVLKRQVATAMAAPKAAAAPPTTALDTLRDKLERKLEAEQEKHQGTKRKLDEIGQHSVSNAIVLPQGMVRCGIGGRVGT